jgi:hypothetical protein
MTKPTSKPSIPAVTQAAGMAGRALARLENTADAIAAKTNGAATARVVLTPKTGLRGFVTDGQTIIEFENGSIAVSIAGKEGAQ